MSLQLPPGVSLDQIPSWPPPPGAKALDYESYPAWRNRALLGISITFTLIAGAFVFGRVYLNLTNRGRRLWWDDVFAVIGLILEIGYMCTRLAFREYWQYLWNIPLSWLTPAFFKSYGLMLPMFRTFRTADRLWPSKSDFAANMLLGPAQFFAKGSIILLYLRLFYPHKQSRYILFATFAFSFITYFINVPVTGYYCAPRHGLGWTIMGNAPCEKSALLGPTQGSANVVVDIILLVLPLREVMKLNLSPEKKYLLVAVFASGFFAVVASIVGLVFRVQQYRPKSKGYITYLTYNTSLCIFIETYITLCCSSAPAFASLIQRRANSRNQTLFTSTIRSRLRSLLRLRGSNRSNNRANIAGADAGACAGAGAGADAFVNREKLGQDAGNSPSHSPSRRFANSAAPARQRAWFSPFSVSKTRSVPTEHTGHSCHTGLGQDRSATKDTETDTGIDTGVKTRGSEHTDHTTSSLEKPYASLEKPRDNPEKPYDSNGQSNMTGRGYWESVHELHKNKSSKNVSHQESGSGQISSSHKTTTASHDTMDLEKQMDG